MTTATLRATTRRQATGHRLSRRLGVQALLVAAAFVTYFGVRGLTESSADRAQANAESLVALERRLGILWEPAAQDLIADRQWLVDLANWIYIWGHWPLIAVVAVWLFARHREHFFLLRNAIFISGAIGLVVFVAFPVMPPRLLPGFGVVDTITQHSTAYRTLQPPAFVNQYAAVPSLHVGFDLLVGLVLFRSTRSRAVKALALAMPVAMVLAVVLTANHYVIDIVAGVAVSLAGLALATRLRKLRRTPDHEPHIASPATKPPRIRNRVSVTAFTRDGVGPGTPPGRACPSAGAAGYSVRPPSMMMSAISSGESLTRIRPISCSWTMRSPTRRARVHWISPAQKSLR
jgi:hypothetical protein